MTGFILASGSAIRRQILTGAGVRFDTESPGVDEDALKEQMLLSPPADVALALAQAKALAVSARHPQALVLGADQVLAMDGKVFDKAKDEAEARQRLEALRGRTHTLEGGLAAARGGDLVWTHQSKATLKVREFSDGFLDFYMERAGGELTASVGAYAYEGLGAQLFEAVEGDYYAILGLPLLPVLELLRREGVVMT